MTIDSAMSDLTDTIPRTGVDKFDKRALRARYAEGSLAVEEVVARS